VGLEVLGLGMRRQCGFLLETVELSAYSEITTVYKIKDWIEMTHDSEII
jgi:hypothetical protein